MTASIILNAALVLLNVGCFAWALTHTKQRKRLFRFFTALSNMFCAFAAVAVIIAQLCGSLPLWVLLFKYSGTCAVTVTMLTVLCFLLPLFRDFKALLWRAELFMHLICPLIAVVSFLVFEKTEPMPAWSIALGVAPVVIYAGVYCKKVIYSPEDRRWEDFYGFNHSGKWPLSFALMLIASGLIAFALWAI